MKNRVLTPLSTVLLALTWIVLAVVTFVVNVEYYDAYEYILSGIALWGDSIYWYPKNPLLSMFYGLVYTPFAFLGERPSLFPFHASTFVLHTLYLYATAKWLKRIFPELPLALLAAVAGWNRIFIHMAPFSLPDLLCSLFVALWLWADAATDPGSRKGKLLRMGVLCGLVLGRPHTVLVAAGHIAWRLWRSGGRAWKGYAQAIAGSIVLYVLLFGFFFATGFKTGFFDGIAQGIEFTLQYARGNAGIDEGSALVYFSYAFNAMTPFGILLLLWGMVCLWRADRARYAPLYGPLVGSALFLAFLFLMGGKETRYLSPVLPIFAALQCIAVAWALKRHVWAGAGVTLALFLSLVPELWHFTDPYYRADLGGRTARRIAEWSRSNYVVFLRHMHAFYPQKHYMHSNDKMFYFQHWAMGAFNFHTGLPWKVYRGPLGFTQFGYPLPDNIQQIAPAGVTMVLPALDYKVTTTAPPDIEPLYTLRWWPRAQTPAGTKCHEKIVDPCVELNAAFEGYKHGT